MLSEFCWDDLDFFHSGEWQVIQEHLDDISRFQSVICPKREFIFAALDAVPFSEVKVCFMGQDPYPNPEHATGIAFEVPASVKTFPPTLVNIFREYVSDLHFEFPTTGSLQKWTEEGVLLLNSIPTCDAWESLSHEHWVEWRLLTSEIISKLDDKGTVFILCGARAREYSKLVTSNSRLIEVSHPSPRASAASNSPFIGSRIFSRANACLCDLGDEPIDWRL